MTQLAQFQGMLTADGYEKRFKRSKRANMSVMTRAASKVTPVLKVAVRGPYPWSRTTVATNQLHPGAWYHWPDFRVKWIRLEGDGAEVDLSVTFPEVILGGPGLGPHYDDVLSVLNALTHQTSQLIERVYRLEQSSRRLERWSTALAILTIALIVSASLSVLVALGWRP